MKTKVKMTIKFSAEVDVEVEFDMGEEYELQETVRAYIDDLVITKNFLKNKKLKYATVDSYEYED